MRISVAILGSLSIPAILLGGYSYLSHGGLRADFAREERAAAIRTLTALQQRWQAALTAAALQQGPECCALALDATSRPTGPFVPWPRPLPSAEAELRLDLARTIAAQGQHAEARAMLARDRARTPALECTPLGFDLLARMLDASIAHGFGDPAPAMTLRQDLLTGRVALPAAAAQPVLAHLATLLPAAASADTEVFLAAARWHLALEAGERAPPTSPELGAGGEIVVPVSDGLAILARNQQEALLEAALREAPTGLSLSRAPGPAVASLRLQPGDTEVFARYTHTTASSRLGQIAQGLLALAAAAFVLLNLLTLRLARKELALSRLKSEFIDLVSHELRTPLQALSLKTEMLAHGDVPAAKVAEYTHAAHDEVLRLTALVRRILDFARLDKQRGAPVLAALDVRRFLARCVRESRAEVRFFGHRLAVQAARELPQLAADGDLLATAVRNLLENAAKYSPPGTTITLRAERSGTAVALTVGDEGSGVPEPEQAAIFEPFRRGVRAPGRTGRGLGLAIVAAAARRHHGSITVANRPEGGAVFTLRIPTREIPA